MHWTILSRIAFSTFLVSLSYYVVTSSFATRWYAQDYATKSVDTTQSLHGHDAASWLESLSTETKNIPYIVSTTTHTSPQVTAKSSFKTTSWRSSNGEIEHYILERRGANSDLSSALFLTITNDEESWGRNPAENQRSIYDHLDFVTNTTLLPEQTSIGLLTSSRSEFQRYIDILTPSRNRDVYFDYPFARIVLVLHTAHTRALRPGKEVANLDGSRGERHNIPQHERRAVLAKLRNYLTSISLSHETHVVWFDSDVYMYNSDSMIEYMMKRTTTTEEREVGILTARCRRGEPWKAEQWLREHPDFEIPRHLNEDDSPEVRHQKEEMRGEEGGRFEIIAHLTHQQGNYDLNAWAGRRVGPNNAESEALWRDLSAWEPGNMPGKLRVLDKMIEDTSDEDLVQLDSVGGTILMINSELIRMGLIWPTGYFIGMTFEHGEGFDGIESEGLCLLTRSMSRDGSSMCFTLGGQWSVWHTVF